LIGPIPLQDATLRRLAARVAVPSYERAALRPGVVHLSVGAFHRSHQAVYFDEVAALGHRDWGIVGVGLRRAAMRDALRSQDGLYTVVERGTERDAARVVGVMTRYLLAPQERREVLRALSDPRTHVVTLTVTAAAYAEEDEDLPGGRASRDAPGSAIGYLVEALAARREAGIAPFTVLSCDNIPANGDAARQAVVGRASGGDRCLAGWIEEHVAFPSGMVDRITPRTTAADRNWVARRFGVRDRWPVITEPFSQWILEDDFCGPRPPLEEVGVQLVSDVRPYSLMKTRLLNAGHCALGYLGSLAGLKRTDEAVGDPLLRAYLQTMLADEVVPLLPAVPGTSLDAYCDVLLGRLANPHLADTLERLCRAGSSKIPAHVLPSIVQARAAGRDHSMLTLAVAAWFRHLRGVDERGRRVPLDDPLGARLRSLALAGGSDPRPLLAERGLFGDLREDPGFVRALREALLDLEQLGVRRAVAGRLPAERVVAA
jgi:fructuronate reductase/mannitol 2-dehydrogenase